VPADITALNPKRQAEAPRVPHGQTKEISMRVRMLTNRKGSSDGVHAERFMQGQVYDLPASLAKPYLERGYAEQDKMVEAAPETKEALPAATDGKKAKRGRE
jgi:hypothetical protein